MAGIKRLVIDRIGRGPLHNRKLQIVHAPSYPTRLLHERREARRAGIVTTAHVVTIIATVGRPSLVRAVCSALAQDVPDHRIVVVSDGPHQLPDLPAGVIILPTSAQCGVVGVVRNIGLSATRSAYVAFLDDDNSWYPHHLSRCLTLLTAGRADLVYASALRVRRDGTHYDTIGQPWNRELMRHSNYVDASAIVARRCHGLRFSRTPRIGPGTGSLFSEDWELMYRASRRRQIEWTQATTVEYVLSDAAVAFLDHLQSLWAQSAGE